MKIQIEFYSNHHWDRKYEFLFNILPCFYISNENGFALGVGWLFWGFEIYKGGVKMTKEQAISAAEKFLLAVYGNEYEACASIVTASAEKNCWYLSKSLDEVIKLCESIKEGLKG